MHRKAGSVKRKVVASDLQEERDKIAFDQEELRVFLGGGEVPYQAQKAVVDTMGADDVLRNRVEFNDLTIHEQQKDLWKRNSHLYFSKLTKQFTKTENMEYPYTDWFGYFQGLLPGFGLHFSMFRMSVANLSNAEQKAYWIPKINNIDILGCYAQTEIGHGSNVAGIETTATLDKATDEFVIHTPSISATKYWPGDLGRFSSHAVLFARLIIDGEDNGVQPFMVPIRDVATWKLLPGVKAGDLGPKIGYHSKDNGWAQFDKVRIPRTYMLMGLCEVDKQGEVSLKGDPRVLYSVMMTIRMLIVQACGYFSLISSRIAIRYCSVRRQFSSQQGTKEERKVIDYQTQQYLFAKLISRGVTSLLASRHCIEQFRLMMDEVKQGKFARMDVTHHLLSGFKSIMTDDVMIDIDQSRRACGGAGYQSSSGFTQAFQLASPMPTYEGDNTVMLGQASRYLIKIVKKASEGKKVPAPFTYLNNMRETLTSRNQARTVEDFLDIDVLDRALQARCCNLISQTMKEYNSSDAPSKVKDNELFYVAKIAMTRAHFQYLQFHLFRTHFESHQFADPRIPKVLTLIGKVYALVQLLTDGVAVFDSGFLAPGSMVGLNSALERCVKELRPQFVPVSESIFAPDHIVPSTIGNEYGDIYENQLDTAMKSRLNINNEVPEYFEELMKPILQAKL